MNSTYAVKTKLRELIISAFIADKISKDEAVARLNVSMRQFYRLVKRYHAKDLTHGLCNKASNHSLNLELKNRVIELYRSKYHSFNYEHLHEVLNLWEGIQISADTIRRILLDARLSLPRRRKTRTFTYRQPKAQFNEMLQLDGTFGDFLGTGEQLCLMHLVDDATKTSMAILGDSEGTYTALEILYQWCIKYGIPQCVYTDRHTTYKSPPGKLTIDEELSGVEARLTNFGQVCQRLGIEQIFAYSPQAKGRVERRHQLYKDRAIKELRIHGIKSIKAANSYLNEGFTERINTKFTIKPIVANSAGVLVSPTELAEQFSINITRTVRNDCTVQFNNQVYQLHKIASGTKIIIKTYLNNSVAMFAHGVKINYTPIEHYIKPVAKIPTSKKLSNCTKVKPLGIHPFKRHYKPEKKIYPSSSKQLQQVGVYYANR